MISGFENNERKNSSPLPNITWYNCSDILHVNSFILSIQIRTDGSVLTLYIESISAAQLAKYKTDNKSGFFIYPRCRRCISLETESKMLLLFCLWSYSELVDFERGTVLLIFEVVSSNQAVYHHMKCTDTKL